jgi:two-component system nitrogen regulation response regulator NtrX
MNEIDELRKTVLVVDDEPRVRKSIVEFLAEEGYRVIEAGETAAIEKALTRDGNPVDLVLLDVRMPGEDGVAFLQRRADLVEEIPFVMMSGHGTIELAVEAVRLGAFDFLEKGFTPERLGITLDRAFRMAALRRQNLALREERGALHQIVGETAIMHQLREAVHRAAPTPAKVLILGENGVGKELVARAIHDLSARRDGTFVRLNCAAIPKDLVESELFGHEKGAFTGASALKRGKLELAHGGTLFLDEIGDMSLEAQAKLLRALESSEFERVGGTRTLTFDARIIAATNKDRHVEVAEGRFRRDLFYRLNVLPITVPPLRERAEDIALLAEHYLTYFRREYGRPKVKLTADATRLLTRAAWPGNVRELRNVIERLVIMAADDAIGPAEVLTLCGEDPGLAGLGGAVVESAEGESGGDLLKHLLDGAEREILEAELAKAGWNVSQAARTLGIDRANLHRKMRRLGIERRG